MWTENFDAVVGLGGGYLNPLALWKEAIEVDEQRKIIGRNYLIKGL